MKIKFFFAAFFLLAGTAAAELTPKPPSAAQLAAGRANAIAFRFYAKAGETPGNVFFSPYSLYSAFSMLYEGARGATADEMRSVFDFQEGTAAARGEVFVLRKAAAKAAKGAVFTQANALWYQKGYEFLPDYERALKRYYAAPAEAVNFRTAPAKAVAEINAWVSQRTGNRIKELFDNNSVNGLTRLVLANAVFFKGSWSVSFDVKGTSPRDFTLDGGEKAQVPTMYSGGPVRAGYYEDAELQAAALAYEGGTLRMLVLLPRPGSSAAELGRALSPERLSAVRAGLRSRSGSVTVYLPSFKFGSSWNLSPMLAGLGMPKVFAQGADLSGMDGTTNFYVQSSLQKAYVEVNEEGTVAAAATGIAAMPGAARKTKPKVFRADRPFLFLIEDARTGLILFMGRVSDPRAAAL